MNFFLRYGRVCNPRDRFGIEQTEFSLQGDCLLRGIRVYIPIELRKKVLMELHTGHFGNSKMKALARAYCWWPKLDMDIEDMVLNCSLCQAQKPNPQMVPVHCWLPPRKVFERVHVDFAGPFMGKYFFVLIDALSKWPEIHMVPNITTTATILKCKQIFSTFGLPNILDSDHGSQFNSSEFKCFLKENGIVHKQGAPYHPATNGQAERFIQTFKNKMKSMRTQASTIENDLAIFLLAYRRSIHPSTGKSPAMLMLGRQIPNRLDLLVPEGNNAKERRAGPTKSFRRGDRVAVRDYMANEKWRFGAVTETKGDLHYRVQLDDNRTWTRHVDQMRKVGKLVGHTPADVEVQPSTVTSEVAPASIRMESPLDAAQDKDSQTNSSTAKDTEKVPRRSERERKPPERLQYSTL